MAETLYHVRSALTGARVIIGLTDRALAERELDRLNQEATTGIRAEYGEGDNYVLAQRLSDGPIQHLGKPMEYELEIENPA